MARGNNKIWADAYNAIVNGALAFGANVAGARRIAKEGADAALIDWQERWFDPGDKPSHKAAKLKTCSVRAYAREQPGFVVATTIAVLAALAARKDSTATGLGLDTLKQYVSPASLCDADKIGGLNAALAALAEADFVSEVAPGSYAITTKGARANPLTHYTASELVVDFMHE